MRAHEATTSGSRLIPRIALVGCGAIAERYHLPALARLPDVAKNAVLVDRDVDRCRDLADRFGVPETSDDFRDVLAEVQGAVVATPPDSHSLICSEFLNRGISVLCEKPLAESVRDARGLVDAAAAHGASLCVNQTRRLFPASGKIRELVHSGALGELRSIEYVDGNAFRWPAATGFHFRVGARGVLLDRGVHSLDLICWWLGSKPRLAQSLNDSYGGPESIAWLQLDHGTCRINLKLSWMTNLESHYRIEGEDGAITSAVEGWDEVRITRPSGRVEVIPTPSTVSTYHEFGAQMFSNFVDVVLGEAEPLVPGADVLDSLALIEEAYQTAERVPEPWAFGGAVDE